MFELKETKIGAFRMFGEVSRRLLGVGCLVLGMLGTGCVTWLQDKGDDEATMLQIAKSSAEKKGFEHSWGPLMLRGGPIVRKNIEVETGYCYRLGVAWPSSFPVYVSILFLKGPDGFRPNAYRRRLRRTLLYGADTSVFCADRSGRVRVSVATMNRTQSALLNIRTMYAVSLSRRRELSIERLLRHHQAWRLQQKAKERREAQKGE